MFTNQSSSTSQVSLVVESQQSSSCFKLQTLETVPSSIVQSFIILLFSLTSLLSLVGNVIVIVVQIYGRESNTQNIRKYLINLAVSDIVIGVLCVPFSYSTMVLRQWIFPHWLCPTAQYVQLLSVFITSASLTIIGIERYLATLHPLSCPLNWFRTHTKALIASTWVLGAIFAYIPLSHSQTTELLLNGQTYYQCSYQNNWSKPKRHFYMISNFVITFLIPSAILTFSYIEIMRKLKRSKMKNYWTIWDSRNSQYHHKLSTDHTNGVNGTNGFAINPTNNNTSTNHNHQTLLSPREVRLWRSESTSINSLKGGSKQIKNRSKTIKTMFVIIILYDICWLPIKLYQFLMDNEIVAFCSEFQFYALIYGYLVLYWLAMANSFANPIVYSFMSKSFRNDLRRISKAIWKRTHGKKKFNLDAVDIVDYIEPVVMDESAKSGTNNKNKSGTMKNGTTQVPNGIVKNNRALTQL